MISCFILRGLKLVKMYLRLKKLPLSRQDILIRIMILQMKNLISTILKIISSMHKNMKKALMNASFPA